MGSSGDVSRRLLEAFNAGDWDAFRAGLADDAVYVESGTGRRVEGADAYTALCQEWRRALPDVHGTVLRTVESGDVTVQEVVWNGTHDGPLPTPTGPIPATGRHAEVSATLWTEVRDGRVTEVHHHIDILALLAQIGALPGTEVAAA